MTGAGEPSQTAPDAAPSEVALLRGARNGERAAVERLYAGHVDWARRIAAIVAGPEAAEALVSETFARAFGQLRAGRGPSASFGPHLLTTMSAVHRSTHGMPAVPPVDGIDPTAATAAVAALPERMRQALWLAEVEGRRPDVIAQRLGAAPDTAASLVDRSRKRLRRDYLDRHGAAGPTQDACRWTRKRLGGHVRGDLGRRPSAKVAGHLAACSACAAAHIELTRLDARLATDLFPVMLAGELGAADRPADDRSRALGELPGRTTLAVAASVVAVVAIAAASWGLARHEGEQRTAPTEPESSGVTFGPNPPAVPPTTSYPTLPEASAPTFPSPEVDAPTPSAPPTPYFPSSTTTTPSSPYTPYTTSTYGTTPTTSTTPTTTASTSPTAAPGTGSTKVRPVAPTARKINRCGTYGSLRLPQTVGVRYAVVVGNRREGRWVVRATATTGYVIAAGAPRRFSGNLGRFEPCPTRLAIGAVATAATGDSAQDPWVVKVRLAVPEKERRELSVTYVFDTEVVVLGRKGSGWTCHGPEGVGIGTEERFEPGAAMTCTFGDSTRTPPPVSLTVQAFDESGSAVGPSGTVSLLADGDRVDVEYFQAADR